MSASAEIRLRVSGRPPTLNELMDKTCWQKAHRLKSAWTSKVFVAKYNQRAGKAERKRRVDMVVALGKGKRQTDPDALWKASLDALKLNGLLVDDSPDWCEMGTVTQERSESGESWTLYILTETAA